MEETMSGNALFYTKVLDIPEHYAVSVEAPDHVFGGIRWKRQLDD